MDIITDPLINAVQEFFPHLLKIIGIGLNVISIFLAWAGFFAGVDGFVLITILGGSFFMLGLVFSGFSGSFDKGALATDYTLMILSGLAYFLGLSSKNNIITALLGLSLATYVTGLCFQRMRLGHWGGEIANTIVSLAVFVIALRVLLRVFFR